MTLFIDTHGELITVALKQGKMIFKKEKLSERSHSVYLLPLIEELFVENNLEIKSIKRIVVVNGPGSFTGIRIGLTVAKTLAYTLSCEIVTISSLLSYLVSSDIKGNRMCLIEDNNGFYISGMDSKDNIIIDETYKEENSFNFEIVENKLNIEKILEYTADFKTENPHFVKANYIKKIEVERD